jgi:hypothetical protein
MTKGQRLQFKHGLKCKHILKVNCCCLKNVLGDVSTLICVLLIWRNVALELFQSSELSEQQKVAIPGWLREDKKEGLHQMDILH